MMMMRSDLGVWGFLLSLMIHFQIYCVLFALSWCSYTVGLLVESIQKLRDIQAGTYTGLELGVELDVGEMSF
jgi:DMSO/TMAO reductase YedYZ heme-binding membrane subunit